MNDVWAPGATGTGFVSTVATGATGSAVLMRAAAPTPYEVRLKAVISTAASSQISGFVIAFGDESVAAPVDTDMLIDTLDGWVRVKVPAGVTHIRIKSPTTGGAAGGVRGYVCSSPRS